MLLIYESGLAAYTCIGICMEREVNTFACHQPPHNGKHMARKALWFILFQIFYILTLLPTKQFIRISAWYLLSCPLRNKNATNAEKNQNNWVVE